MKELMISIAQSEKTFKALGESNRLRILKMLEIRPLCVCEITEVLQLATSTVSKHLSILRDAGFIIDHKEGKWINYCLIDTSEEETHLLHRLLSSGLNNDETIQHDAEKVRSVDRYKICDV
ncbi:ArsR/SmtB family transcription factor [Candidatus Neomarinimicrobiota bacterium]